ncbi:MAG: hypothetical protein GF400_03925 [Candidatus Eisenbacteria bacterium]|nr:hypothetical protein [Candidatus Eisenbacteria bacterium]
MNKVIVVAAALLLLTGTAGANFAETEVGARPMGMGGAFVAVADDVTALHWNPAGLANLEGVQLFGMRTSVYSVDGLSEDSAMAVYGDGCRGFAAGWMRTGAEDLYNEDVILFGVGTTLPPDGLSAGFSIKRLSIQAPGYEYYNDPAFDGDGDSAYTGDLGLLYRRGSWSAGATYRNIGEPELQLLSTTEDPDPVVSEFRLGGSYLFREVMLMTAEWRVPREVPSYYERKSSFNLGTEVWFYEVVALRAGMNRDRITAGLGLKADPVRIDVALLSERRIGSLYRLSAIFTW